MSEFNLKDELQKKLKIYTAQREQMQMNFHQLQGAIAAMNEAIVDIDKCVESEPSGEANCAHEIEISDI